jgi:predicted TIM-barrel fold metal-dependent hydrolase
MLNRREWLMGAAGAAGLVSTGALAAQASVPLLPYGLFDTHAHLISGDEVRYPRAVAEAGTPATGALVQMPEVEKLLGWMDESHVAGGVAVQRRGTYGYNNNYVLDSTDRFRSRLMPVVMLDAADPATPELLQQYVRERGLAGLRLTGAPGDDGALPWLGSPAALRSWTVAQEYGLAMVVMTSPPGRVPQALSECQRLASQFPGVRLVLDHLAWPDLRGAPDFGVDATLRALAPVRNIHFKFTSVNIEQLTGAKLAPADTLRRVVDAFGADRVMWGSDIGNSAGTYGEFVRGAIAATAQLNAEEQRKVLRDTGMRVFVRGGLRRA